jgi:hypothetical protein
MKFENGESTKCKSRWQNAQLSDHSEHRSEIVQNFS